MFTDVTLPALGESVSEATISHWRKRVGDRVTLDEPIVEVSTDKVDQEIPSPATGILVEIRAKENDTVPVGALLATISTALGTEDGEIDPTVAQAEAAVEVVPPAPQPEPPQQPPVQQEFQPPAPPVEQVAPQPVYVQQPAQPDPSAQVPPVAYEQPQQGAPQAYDQPTPQAGSNPPAGPGWTTLPAPVPPWTPWSPGGASPEQGQPAESIIQPLPPADQGIPQPPVTPVEPAPATSEVPVGQPVPTHAFEEADQALPTDIGAAAAEEFDRSYVTPLVRKLANEKGIDLASVVGTGVGGRIRKQDILDEADRAAQAAALAAQTPGPLFHAEPGSTVDLSDDTPSGLSLAGPMRPNVARGVADEPIVWAQCTATVEVDMTGVMALVASANATPEAHDHIVFTPVGFLAKAVVEALRAHPQFNTATDPLTGALAQTEKENLGITVDMAKRVAVAVIEGAGDLSIGGLAHRIGDLQTRAQGMALTPEDLMDGTFTITTYATLTDTPVVIQPQVAILGMGAITKRPVVVEDSRLGPLVVIRDMTYLSLSYDHRLITSGAAGQFLGTIKARLEAADFETQF